jgi:hypothetical protein
MALLGSTRQRCRYCQRFSYSRRCARSAALPRVDRCRNPLAGGSRQGSTHRLTEGYLHETGRRLEIPRPARWTDQQACRRPGAESPSQAHTCPRRRTGTVHRPGREDHTTTLRPSGSSCRSLPTSGRYRRGRVGRVRGRTRGRRRLLWTYQNTGFPAECCRNQP